MSRNVRQKTSAPPPPKKRARKLATPSTDSSDDDYNGVNDISDDEDDEPDVLAAEEQAIIDTLSPEGADEDDGLATRPFPDDEESWEGFPIDDDELPSNAFYNPHDGLGTASPIDVSSRRVSFDLQSDISGSENGDVNDDMFPDLFVDQDSLDPTFRRRVEADEDDQGSDTYWGLSDEEFPSGIIPGKESSDAEDYSDDSDDYSDEGDTTDEEDEPPIVRERISGRNHERTSSPSSPSSAEEEMTIARRTPLKARKPQLGKWVHPANTPFATVAADGKSLLMFRKQDEPSTPHADPAAVIQFQTTLTTQFGGGLPTMGDSGNVMMSAMCNPLPFDNLFGNLAGQVIGPSEAFFPFTSINSDGTYTQDSSSIGDDYDEDFEVQFVDFGAAINFDGGETTDAPESEGESPTSPTSPTMVEPPSTPAPFSTPVRSTTDRPTTPASESVHPLLTHFNSTKVSVGAFRQNQNRHHQLTSNMVSQESLAFHNSQSPAPIRGIRSGRIPYTNTPITPARKQKSEKRTMPSSPTNGDERSHKRNRSLY